jgi:hypothetical protein
MESRMTDDQLEPEHHQLTAEMKLKLLIDDRPWEKEPNDYEWEEQVSGYKCHIRRNMSTYTFCGYVTVPKGHPFYGLDYDHDNLAGIVAHGGLTYSDEGTFGFDCAHAGDFCPGVMLSLLEAGRKDSSVEELIRIRPPETYRTFEAVMQWTIRLAHQLREVADLASFPVSTNTARRRIKLRLFDNDNPLDDPRGNAVAHPPGIKFTPRFSAIEEAQKAASASAHGHEDQSP